MSGSLENYFASFAEGIIGRRKSFKSTFGTKELVYADWTATGRAYRPIEDYLQKEILPFVGNTHTDTTITGTLMTKHYAKARQTIKECVGAGEEEIVIFCGSGMTAAVNKLQRLMGLRIPDGIKAYLKKDISLSGLIDEELKPVVFVTHMEHHSNYISWIETIADVEVIGRGADGNVDLNHFQELLEKYKQRKSKIAAVTACSNVTGIQTPYHEIAKLIHRYDGLCFVDFACSAPYVSINMHPNDERQCLDAIYFSPHKFLGGPGTPGVLIFNRKFYHNQVPDHPGGGTVIYSNPWMEHEYVTSIEEKEDGGTPPFIGAIKAALCFRLKEEMKVENIHAREKEILKIVFERLSSMQQIEILERDYTNRLAIISFVVLGGHYNSFIAILNDRFGIQARGGCSCAGGYGHVLLNLDRQASREILRKLRTGNTSAKPGWVRLSFHPCMTDDEVNYIMDSVELTALNFKEWKRECLMFTEA